MRFIEMTRFIFLMLIGKGPVVQSIGRKCRRRGRA